MNHELDITKQNENGFVISYLTLRKAVGILGIALPIVLLTGFYFMDAKCPFPPSISHYYYTNLGTYFTGTLCAVSLFLFSYNGLEPADRKASLFAAICALGVAFSPTNTYYTCCNGCTTVNLGDSGIRNGIHYASAGLLFLTFAYFCLKLFVKKSKNPTKEKLMRNLIYRICGYTIIVSIICVPVFSLTTIGEISFIKDFKAWTFVFETIALFAFGYSWLIKGETFFKDKK